LQITYIGLPLGLYCTDLSLDVKDLRIEDVSEKMSLLYIEFLSE